MTTPLRTRVVEAGARAVAEQNAGWTVAAARDDVVAALDAMLGCLFENVEEWEQLYGRTLEEGRVKSIASGLLAVLKDADE